MKTYRLFVNSLYISILGCLGMIIFSCSSSDGSINDDGSGSIFSISLVANNSAEIDEIFTVEVTANESMARIDVLTEELEMPAGLITDFGTTKTLYLSFSTSGTKTITVKAMNEENIEVEEIISVNIIRGDAIKINSIQLTSFNNIDGTWDNEFDETDPESLADVFYVLLKPQAGIFENTTNFIEWFRSEVEANQGDLTWDVSSANLFIDPNLSLRFSAADDDGGGLADDLMLGPPFDYEVTFSEHIPTQPEMITLSVPSIDLEVIFNVEW